jgi:hypothetical protein
MTLLLFILSVLCASSPLSPALSPETLIQTPAGFVQIQYLNEGDTVAGIDLHTQKKVTTKILKIRRYLVASRIKITTDQAVFTVSDDQLMRLERAPPDRAQIVDSDPLNCFVAAQNLRVGDRLQTYDGNYQTITKIERIEPTTSLTKDPQLFRPQAHSATECAIFYGLHLDEPHHFYATEQNILMHNFAIAAPLAGELASMVCALGVGAAGSYLSPHNSGFNTPAFRAPATAPASSVNNFTQFRFDQLTPPVGELSAFSFRNTGNFNDNSFLFSGAQSTRLSMVPAGNFIYQYPDFTWTFNGLIGFDGNLLFQAIAKEPSTDLEHDAGIFRGHRYDPYLQQIIHAHDAALARELEHYFDDLSDEQFELLASQTGCYDDKTAEVQTALAAVDLTYAGSHFASTVAYVCKQENISLSAIMHTINHGTKASSVYRLSPNYKVYESAENKLKVLTYEKPFSTILILGVSDSGGFVQVPRDATALETYYTWREKKLEERQHAEAARKKQNYDKQHTPNALGITDAELTQDAADMRKTLEIIDASGKMETLKVITKWELEHTLEPYPDIEKKISKTRWSFCAWHFNQQALFGLIAAGIAPRVITNAAALAVTAVECKSEQITAVIIKDLAFIVFDHEHKNINRVFRDVDRIKIILNDRTDINVIEFTVPEVLRRKIIPREISPSRDDLPLPEDALSSCGTGKLKSPFPEPPAVDDTISNPPEVTCGGSGLLPNPEKGGCGTGLQKEPKPKETCNWSQGQKFPSLNGGDEVQTEGDESGKESNTVEDEKEPPIDSDAPSIEKPIDESVLEIKSIDEPATEEVPAAALRPTDLERIDGSSRKQEHIIEGSKGHNHRLELVAPDKTWEEVRPIIEDIMNTGEQGKDQTDDGVRCKFKYIDNHPVVVKYKEGTCINHIGTMFIPTTDNIDGYIPKDKQK